MGIKPLSILIVEDNEDIRLLLKEALSLFDHNVTVAANGLEALERTARLQKLDIILLDLMMPVMDGWAFLEARTSMPELTRVPVIVMSGAASNLPSGPGVALLPKPVDLTQLFQALESLTLPSSDASSRQLV